MMTLAAVFRPISLRVHLYTQSLMRIITTLQASNLPSTQAWGNTTVPTFIEPATTILSPLSNYSPDAFNALQQKNLQMQKEIALLHSTVQKLLQDHENNYAPSTPSPLPSTIPLTDIVAAVVKALESCTSIVPTSTFAGNQTPASNANEHKRKSTTSVNTKKMFTQL